MNANQLYLSLNDLDDDLIARSEISISAKKSISIRRHLSVGIIAAILMTLLIGGGVATMIYSDNIQHWFGHYWEMLTGYRMSETHANLIDHLSQDIGINQTVDNVTVTVDSATVGDDSFFLLIKISGLELSDKYDYSFGKMSLDISPEPWGDNAGVGSFGADFHGIDQNNDGLFLFTHDYTSNGEIMTTPLDITLSLSDFSRLKSGENEIIASGPWDFQFTITPNILDDVITIPDTTVIAFDHTADEYTEVPVVISNIEINSTSLKFDYAHNSGTLTVDSHIYAVLEGGQEIRITGGSGTVEDDILHNIYRWQIPIELSELTAIKIGNTMITVP